MDYGREGIDLRFEGRCSFPQVGFKVFTENIIGSW
jgi:hypothetical protein